MTILRAVARTMLASYFIVNGYKAMRHPEEFAEAAEPVAETLLPLANRTLPKQAAVYLPQDTTALVKATGIAQLIGGLSLATGIGRRVGAGVLAATMLPHVVASNPLAAKGGERESRYALLSKNVAILGGVALAAMDTEGRPNLAWKARAQKEIFARESSRAKLLAEKKARQLAKAAKKTAGKATKEIASVIS
ncbi:MAG: DoxX family protein [Actinobacteria bacterium]|nr:DoxX family protein [Actinomycetota bacterium]